MKRASGMTVSFFLTLFILMIFLSHAVPTSFAEAAPQLTPSPASYQDNYSTINPNYYKWWKSENSLISGIVHTYYGSGRAAWKSVDFLLQELDLIDPKNAMQWRNILEYWDYVENDMELNDNVLPDGLNDTNTRCIIVPGYFLLSDGTMHQELLGRMETVLRSAQKYPNAFILCTGGGTAPQNKAITEAHVMAQWLIDNGIDEERIIIEDTSTTTEENVRNSCKILVEKYPDITDVALVSSDYHVRWMIVQLNAQIALENYPISIVSNADYPTQMRNNNVRGHQMEGILIIAELM